MAYAVSGRKSLIVESVTHTNTTTPSYVFDLRGFLVLDLFKKRTYNGTYTIKEEAHFVEAFILLIFSAGIALGSYLTAKILTYRAKKRMQKRGEALRAITYHKWDTGDHNDAVVITRIALDGLKYD